MIKDKKTDWNSILIIILAAVIGFALGSVTAMFAIYKTIEKLLYLY